MITTSHRWSFIIGLMLALGLLASACTSANSIKGGELPTLAPTNTAQPHVTPTPISAQARSNPHPVNWEDVSIQASAMRSAYVDDVADWVDENRYYIEADLELTNTAAIVNGAQRARYVNRSQDTLNTVVFRLYPNLPALGGNMRILEASIDDQPAEYRLLERDTALSVSLPEPLPPDETVEIVLKFIMVAERGMNASYGRFGYQLNLLAAPGWHPVLSVYEPDKGGWWIQRASPQGDPHYATTALYEVMLTHPANVVTVISGVSIDKTQNSDGTVTEHIASGPMRYSILIASPDIGKLTEIVDDVAVNVYFMPGDERGAEWALTVGARSVAIFNKYFGDYPYAELDIVETFTISGVEFPGVVVITERSWENGSQRLEQVVAHEVAHQWWYGLVGNDQVNHPWVDESLTSFSEVVYWRNAYEDAERRAEEDIQGRRSAYNFYRGSTGAVDLPMDLPVDAYAPN